jgi:hypothetical protein
MKQTFSQQIASLLTILGLFTGISAAQPLAGKSFSGSISGSNFRMAQTSSGVNPASAKINAPLPDPNSPANPMEPK